MSDPQAKKLNLPLYLNPVVSAADRVAMGALQQWYEQTKQSYGDQAGPELDGVIRAFHRDIYLAGLHLYLINPRLCNHVAQALEQTDLTLEALVQQLSACGLWTPASETSDATTFSASQLEQLERLLAANVSSAAPREEEERGEEKPDTTAGTGFDTLTQQLSEQREQLAAMHAELQKLRSLAEEQAQQLRQLKSAGPAPAPQEPAPSQATAEMDVTDMSAQIAQMQKIRKKGVF